MDGFDKKQKQSKKALKITQRERKEVRPFDGNEGKQDGKIVPNLQPKLPTLDDLNW